MSTPYRVLISLLLLGASVGPALAQAPRPAPEPQRPTTAVFGGTPAGRQDTLGMNVSLYGAYDQEFSDDGDQTNEGVADGGPFSGLDLDLSYTPTQRGRVSFDLRGASSFRYYTTAAEAVAASQSGAVVSSMQLNRRLTLQLRGGADYMPYFDFATLPDMEDPLGPEVPERVRDNSLSSRRILTYDGGVDLTHGTNEPTSFNVGYGLRRSELLDEDQATTDATINAGLNRRLNRRLFLRTVYAHRAGEETTAGSTRRVNVDDLFVSLDRVWARSPTRRTQFSFTIGPSRVEQFNEAVYRIGGGVSVTHPFARSWNLRALYRRAVSFLQAESRPFLTNSVNLGVSGLVSRRLDVSFDIGAVLGEVGLESQSEPYDAYAGSTRMRYGFSRSVAAYAEYVYNSSRYSGTSTLPNMDRSGVRAGLTIFWPLLQAPTTRRPQ